MYPTGNYYQRSFSQGRGGHTQYRDDEDFHQRPFPQHRGRGSNRRGFGRPSPSQQKRDNNRIEQLRIKKGTEVVEANRERIKESMFAGVDMDEYNRLAEQQVLQSKMLSITSRGIGMGTTHLTYVAKQYDERIRTPSIYSQYRVYLALLEAKLMNTIVHYSLVPRFSEHVNRHEGLNAEFIRIIKTCSFVPTPIKKIVDAIGILKHEDKIYLPVMAASPTSPEGVIRPRPETTCISNLRATVVALSDSTTSINVRRRYHENCAIPGAIWENHILTNADEIIPADYTFEEGLRNDIMVILPYLNRLQKHAPKMVGGPLDTKSTGNNSLLLSNEMENLKCPDRRVGEPLDDYYDRCILEGTFVRLMA